MRVLWVCNVMLPVFAEHLGLTVRGSGGWLEGCFNRLTKERTDITLGICMPVPENVGKCRVEIGGVIFYGFAENTLAPHEYDSALEGRFNEILYDFKPDLAHVFGTEFAHTLAFAKVYKRPSRLLIGLQGLCGRIADVYMADLPYSVQRGRTIRDRIRNDSLRQQQANFRKRARMEAQALKDVAHMPARAKCATLAWHTLEKMLTE